MDFNPTWLLFPVPDAPQSLQLSLHREVEGVIMDHWAPPVHTHGLIREYIVSSSQEWAVRVGEHGRWLGLLEQNHVLCDADSVWYRLIIIHPLGHFASHLPLSPYAFL